MCVFVHVYDGAVSLFARLGAGRKAHSKDVILAPNAGVAEPAPADDVLRQNSSNIDIRTTYENHAKTRAGVLAERK